LEKKYSIFIIFGASHAVMQELAIKDFIQNYYSLGLD